ncbi:MAG: prefoldin subunit alpha [Nitrososphaerales archaeon]
MSDQERIQSLAMELRMLEGYFGEINTRESLLARAIVESRAALEAIRSFPSNETSDVLVPIGGGVFIEVSAKPPDKLLVSIGADVMIEETKDGAVSFLEERIKELENAISNLEGQKAELAKRIESNRAIISSILEKQKKTQ